mgnify:CR=1 FL=1
MIAPGHGVDADQLGQELQSWLRNASRVVVAGVGNSLRRDDSVGLKVVEHLFGRVSTSVRLIQCETVPESFVESIAEFKPSHILVIDAAMIGRNAGAAVLVELTKAIPPAVSTHALSLELFFEYLRNMVVADIRLLAIQPENTEFGESLTPRVEEASRNIAGLLVQVLSHITHVN